MANLATKAGVKDINASRFTPPLCMSKAEIVQLGVRLGVDFIDDTCYDPAPDGHPCGRCDACQLPVRAFEGGLTDPLVYPAGPSTADREIQQ